MPTSLAGVLGRHLVGRGAGRQPAAGLVDLRLHGRQGRRRRRGCDALVEASDRLQQDFGSWGVPWGEINRFQRIDGAIVQTFDDAKPSIPVPFASSRWGSLASFGAHRWPGTKRYYGTSGNSFVAVVEFGPKVSARAITAGGESGHPDSPHFNDEAERYTTGNLRAGLLLPGRPDGHVERSYHPGRVRAVRVRFTLAIPPAFGLGGGMLLAIDAGNTNLVFALVEGGADPRALADRDRSAADGGPNMRSGCTSCLALEGFTEGRCRKR